MSNAIVAFALVVLAMLALGKIGRSLAETRGLNPWVGFAAGALLPLVGVGILMLVKKNNRNFS